jgi:hypothetical protein
MTEAHHPTPAVPPFVFVVFAIAAAGFFYVQWGRDIKMKRLVWPAVLLATWGTLLVMMSKTASDPRIWRQFLPIVPVPLVLMYFSITFCRTCGTTLRRGRFYKLPDFCSKCGARLKRDP